MAKRRKPAKVTLPPFDWATAAALPGGGTAPLARGAVERGSVAEPAVLEDCGPEPAAIAQSSRVWRLATPPLLKGLGPVERLAFTQYAEAVEAVGASTGTSDPSGGGGGGGGAKSPNLRSLIAAERLRHIHAALAGQEMALPKRHAKMIRRGDRLARLPYRQLVDWVVFSPMTLSDLLDKAGASPRNAEARAAAEAAITDLAQRIAAVSGLCQTT